MHAQRLHRLRNVHVRNATTPRSWSPYVCHSGEIVAPTITVLYWIDFPRPFSFGRTETAPKKIIQKRGGVVGVGVGVGIRKRTGVTTARFGALGQKTDGASPPLGARGLTTINPTAAHVADVANAVAARR